MGKKRDTSSVQPGEVEVATRAKGNESESERRSQDLEFVMYETAPRKERKRRQFSQRLSTTITHNR